MRLLKDRSVTENGIKLTKLPILGYSWYWGGFSLWLRTVWLIGVWFIPLGGGIYTLYYYTHWALAPSDMPPPPRLILLFIFWALAIAGSVWAWRERTSFLGQQRQTTAPLDGRKLPLTATARSLSGARLVLPFVASLLIVPCLLLMYRVWTWRRMIVAELRREIAATRPDERRQ